jgi:ADP-ribosyl-[dinitrogen reductase] hydrolase
VRKTADRVRRLPRAAAEIVQVLDTTRPNIVAGALPTTGYVVDTLRIACWALLAHDTFEEALVAAVNLGGDSDTQGAVTGALAGARWGYDHIPTRWVDPLFDRDFLLSLADTLLRLAEDKRVVV